MQVMQKKHDRIRRPCDCDGVEASSLSTVDNSNPLMSKVVTTAMLRACAKYMAVVLILGIVGAAGASAGFTESFQPSEGSGTDPGSKDIMPGLWMQIGDVQEGSGRGTADSKAAMQFTFDYPTAETVVLTWDGTQDTLDFWYYLTESCEKGVLKISMSCITNKDWFTVWSMKVADMQANAYNIARVRLPLNATCPAFAVRWDYSQSSSCYLSNVYVDDITFPAKPPGGADQPNTQAPAVDPVASGVQKSGTPSTLMKEADKTGVTSSSGSTPGSTSSAQTGDISTNVVVKNKGSTTQVVVGWFLLPTLCLCLL